MKHSERSRKRHKSDDKAKHAKRRALPALPSATTPLSMSALALPRDSLDSGNVDHANSDDEDDDFALPTFKLPGTPTSGTEQGGSATPGSGKQQRTRPTPKKGSKAAGVSVDEASGAGKRQTDLRPATALGEVGNEAGGGTVSGGGQRETSKKRRSGQQSAKKSEQQRKKRKECDSESGDGTAAKMATLEVKEDASKAASEETKGDSRKKRCKLKVYVCTYIYCSRSLFHVYVHVLTQLHSSKRLRIAKDQRSPKILHLLRRRSCQYHQFLHLARKMLTQQ